MRGTLVVEFSFDGKILTASWCNLHRSRILIINSMTKNFSIFYFLIVFVAIACNTTKQKKTSEELYKSSDLTAVNSFTSGAEGPAVDKDGNLYAVNYSKEGTIGKITPTGGSSIFIELPNGS